MMLQHGLSITMLLLSAGLAATGLPPGHGWLDRVVQFQKNKLFNEIKELAPINLNVELRQKSESYEDSTHWDYESVLRLLTLIRQSEKARPVLKALRRMLQPTRRVMMSMKQSMQRFPSLKGDDNNFYYDVDYTSGEENAIPPPVAVPEDQAVIIVSNPVEARLPSAQISVKLLREILEARARAARQMPITTVVVPWIEYLKNRTTTTTEETTEAPDGDQTTGAGTTRDTTIASSSSSDASSSSPDPNATTPDPNATTPDPDATTPDPNATTPDPNATTPDPNATTPDPNATTDDPDATTPDPDATPVDPSAS